VALIILLRQSPREVTLAGLDHGRLPAMKRGKAQARDEVLDSGGCITCGF
jgi:hypothetical protein